MRVTFKPRSWAEVKPDDVITFRQHRGVKNPEGILRYFRAYEIYQYTDRHSVEYRIASLTGTYETKKGERHGVLNPPTYAGKPAYADYVHFAQVVSVTGHRDWTENPADAYDAAHAENAERDAALRVEAAERLHTNDVYRVLGYGRDLPGDPTSFPGVGEMPLPSGRLLTFADLRKHASDLVSDWHGEALKESDERERGWGQPDGMFGTVEADLPQHCGRRWVAEIAKCPRCGLDANAHAGLPSGFNDEPVDDLGVTAEVLEADRLPVRPKTTCGMCGGYGCTLCTPKVNTPAEARTGISDRAAAALDAVAELRRTIRGDHWKANQLDIIEAALRGAR